MGCGCSEGPITQTLAQVFTRRDTGEYTAIWLTAPMAGPAYTKLTVRYYVGAISGNMKFRPVYGHGSNPFSLTVVEFGDEETTSGWHEDAISDVVSGSFYQFGIAVKNNGSTANAESALIESITFTPTTC